MRTNKKILISIIIFVSLSLLFSVVLNMVFNKKDNENKAIGSKEREIGILSNESVTDECMQEWEDYNKELQNAFAEASSNLAEETTHFILKSENGYINIYYADENNEEFLYKKTAISVEYLSPEDIDDLETGIEVVGIETLNKMLEDFE